MALVAGVGIGSYNSGGAQFPNPSRVGALRRNKHAPVCFQLNRGRSLLPNPRAIKARAGASPRQLKVIMATETEKLGIKIVKNPPESKLSELGVRSWPK